MGIPRNALGRGLDALIATPRYRQIHDDYLLCPLDRIAPDPDPPRQYFDDVALEELCQSVREHGLIQPLVVRQHDDDFILIAGERRFRAATRLGLEAVPVVIRDVATDEAFELALIENLQREDLNPMEEAKAYKRAVRFLVSARCPVALPCQRCFANQRRRISSATQGSQRSC